MTIAIVQRVEECYSQAEVFFGQAFPRPQVEFGLRGQSAGVAHLQSNRIRFNATLYQGNRDDFLRQTVAHEVAHLLAFQLFGSAIRPHGAEWQSIMQQVFALEPKRCHSYALPPVWRTLYAYRCDCRQHDLSGQRHARVRKGAGYRCRGCDQLLKFTGQVVRTLVER